MMKNAKCRISREEIWERMMKARLKQRDLILLLRQRGIKTDHSQLSKILNGVIADTPKSDIILKNLDIIIKEYE